MANEVDSSLPFAMQVAANPKIKIAQKQGEPGILIGANAMMAAGAQSEFVTANMMQAQALKSSIILRAGDPPQYNKNRSTKSGLNLSKTSKQGFFKGALSEETRFARLKSNGEPQPHDPKDAEGLSLKPTDPYYQHTMQLDINMRDILREIGPQGDLKVLGFNLDTGLLRLEYREGKGPKKERFDGQFVINLKGGEKTPIFYSREWDKPENDKDWDPQNRIITKPAELASIPDDLYKQIFNDSFKVGYTESKNANPRDSEILSANVMANRARSADDFKQALSTDHPHYPLIKDELTLEDILSKLQENLPQEEANAVILEAYNKSGSIVAGDWDGMALGHPPGLNPQFAEVINVFAPREVGIENKEKLLDRSDAYLKQIQNQAEEKKLQGSPLSAFEEKALSIPSITEIVSDFALARAGCITAHEFVFQQVLNHAYRDKLNVHYGEKYNVDAVQVAMDKLVSLKGVLAEEEIHVFAKKIAQAEIMMAGEKISEPMLDKIAEHMSLHLKLAIKDNTSKYTLPHMQHDVNVHELYQHGFDMRNPYGCNLDGAWFLITADGSTMYGEKQEELIEVLLTGDFLKNNCIEVSHGAEMSAGWGRIIERQIELGQTIPAKTMEVYQKSRPQLDSVDELKLSPVPSPETKASSFANPATSALKEKFASMKQQMSELKSLGKVEKEENTEEIHSTRSFGA